MRLSLLGFVALFFMMISSGCGDDEAFTVRGTVDGADAQSVTLTYYAAGGLKSQTLTLANGAFSFKGRSERPTLALLSVAPDNQRIATLVVANGDEISVEANLEDPLLTKVEGNSDSQDIAKWIADNHKSLAARDAATINSLVADYVAKNKSKRSAAAILVTYFNCEGYESRADSLFSTLDQAVRSAELTQNFNAVVSAVYTSAVSAPLPQLTLYERRDSLVRVNPLRHKATMLCFVSDDRVGRDSIVKTMRRLKSLYDSPDMMLVEISTAADSAAWRSSLGRDSVAWAQTWLRGSVAEASVRRLAISRVPYFIVADSVGNQIYRGSSVGRAASKVEQRLKKKQSATQND